MHLNKPLYCVRVQNWTLKKFVGVTTDKLGLRSREIERLNRDLMMIRMQHEGLNKALPIIADGLNELEDQLKAEPRENPMRIALSMANYGYKQVERVSAMNYPHTINTYYGF
jgi:hypothetical protein